MRKELVSWEEVDKLVDLLVDQFEREYDAMLIVTRGGIIPGGMLAEVLNLTHILTASVDFPAQVESDKSKLMVWPKFIQFPEDKLLQGYRILVVDDVWGSGRTITAVKNRVSAAGGMPSTCVFHFNPHRNLFGTNRPDYYAASTDAYIIYPWELEKGKAHLYGDY